MMEKNFDNQNHRTRMAHYVSQPLAEVNEGLKAYMLKVYNYMSVGLTITGLVAFFTASSPALLNLIFGTPLSWVVMLAPLGFVLFLSLGINRMSAATAQIVFLLYSGVMGLSLASIFLLYTGESVARVFFVTASTFALTSVYGYATKRDLTGMGSFMFMGLIGIVIASLVNLFMQSSALDFALSVLGVLVFVGLTAYDTQSIKMQYYEGDSAESVSKKAIHGALRLYLDFINLFLNLLRLMGSRR